MPFYLKNEFPILFGEISIPRKGNLRAYLEIDGPDPILGEHTFFTIYDEKWEGIITRGGAFAGRRWVEITGGKALLTPILSDKDYQQQPLRIPIQDILSSVSKISQQNMNLNSQYDLDGILNQRLTTWVRVQAPASNQLGALVKHFGDYYWRVLSDGSLGVFNNERNYAQKVFEQPRDYQLMNYDPIWKCSTIAISGQNKMITHFKTFLDKDADYIVHKLDNSKLRTLVWERNP